MKNLYLVLFISLISSTIYSQEREADLTQYNWKTFEYSENADINRFISENKSEFGLTDKDALHLKKQEVDALDIEHYRYEHYFNGVRVDGSQYIIHRSADKMWGNGRLVYDLTADANPALSEDEALIKAMEYMNAPKYYWEDESQEAFIKWFKDDSEATFFPEGELVFSEEKFGQDGKDYQLFWKFDIYAHGEKMREYVYVNANDGSIGHSRDAICYSSVEGTANTYYYGEQTIITDSIADDLYRLVDETRGGGVYTLNLENNPPNYLQVFEPESHFYDNDNNWEGANEGSDAVATVAHWCTEKVYDFYLEEYDRNSFDDEGTKMVMAIHFGLSDFGLDCIMGGFFSGMYAAIGDGPGCSNPGYYLEHIGHEFTHGVISHSAVLESGARAAELGESFCNIMGTAIEFYADPINATWEFKATVPKEMSNPSVDTLLLGNDSFQAPDTYLGDFWVELEDGEDYDVHINAAVQDYWYYLLSEGGIGSNDNGDLYNVEAIGMEKATDIVYRNLTQYMIPAATFFDARQGAIQAAIDLYGECSNEVDQVINAWYAVGVGTNSTSAGDISLKALLSPVNNCGLSEEEIVEVELVNNVSGCSNVIESGSEIQLTYKLDEELVIETLVLSEDLLAGESVIYSFDETISIPDTGEVYTLSVWINYVDDEIQSNDSILNFETGLKYQITEDTMGFVNTSTSLDSFYVTTGENAAAFISTEAANTGDYGFSMSAIGNSLTLPTDPAMNFEFKKGSISEICFCVDAQEWETVSLYFDMKQTRSELYMHFWGTDSAEYTSSMRMMVNGEQFGEQFHPETYVDDPYLSYSYSLDGFELAGTNFEFCFQSKNHSDDAGVPNAFFPFDSDGDNTYLDNIRFVNAEIVSVEEIVELDLNIYPNPANNVLYIESEKALDEVRIFNQLGQHALSVNNFTNPIDISLLERGVYIIEVGIGSSVKREKLIIQ